MPLFFLNYKSNEERYYIVDGQQRFNAILKFHDNKLKLNKKFTGRDNHGKTFNGENPVNDEQREVFLLREYEGLRFNEIAKITGTSVNTAKSRMRYALAALRKFLSQEKITDEVLQNELL